MCVLEWPLEKLTELNPDFAALLVRENGIYERPMSPGQQSVAVFDPGSWAEHRDQMPCRAGQTGRTGQPGNVG